MTTSHLEAIRRRNKSAKVSGTKNDLLFYERQIIEVRIRLGWSTRKIADYLYRSASTVCREVNRNSNKHGFYTAKKAQHKYEQRKGKTNKKKLQKQENKRMKQFVITKIKDKQWSPQQVAGRLKSTQAPDYLKDKSVSHETIYRFIYDTTVGTHLYKYLRRKTTARRKSWQGRSSSTVGGIKEKVPIKKRPPEADERERLGDLESDTMVCNNGYLSVQIDRKSRLVRLTKLESKTAEETLDALESGCSSFSLFQVNTITFDRGTENAKHMKLRDKYDIDTFFCEAYCSWQKGSVENIIGLVRQYLPNNTDMSKVSREEIKRIQKKLNDRPRKSLNYLTPKEYVKKEVNN